MLRGLHDVLDDSRVWHVYIDISLSNFRYLRGLYIQKENLFNYVT